MAIRWACLLVSVALLAGRADAAGKPEKPATRPAGDVALANPWPEKLLNGLPWGKAIATADRMERRSAIAKLMRQWVLAHPAPFLGSMNGEFTGLTPATDSPLPDELTAVFECRGKLADGAPYHAVARVQLAEHANDRKTQATVNAAMRAKVEPVYQVGKVYVVSGTAEHASVGQDVPRGPATKDKPEHPLGVELIFYFKSASIKEYVPPAKK